MTPARCDECGADWSHGSCADLFGRLLALDMRYAVPWGEHHTVNVTTYHLQHPSLLGRPAQVEVMWQWELVYLGGGLREVHAMAAAGVRRNNHRVRLPGPGYLPDYAAEPLPPGPPATPFDVTIADVAVDGTFPAEGYADRAARWVSATVDAWRTGRAGRPG